MKTFSKEIENFLVFEKPDESVELAKFNLNFGSAIELSLDGWFGVNLQTVYKQLCTVSKCFHSLERLRISGRQNDPECQTHNAEHTEQQKAV